MMCLSGQKIHRNLVSDYTVGFRRGDIVGVIVDLNNGRLEFTRNARADWAFDILVGYS